MSELKIDDFPMQIPLPDGRVLRFADKTELSDWLKKEREYWKVFSQLRVEIPFLVPDFQNRFLRKIATLIQYVEKLQTPQAVDSSAFHELFKQIHTGAILVSDSPEAVILKELAKEDPDAAMAATVWFGGSPLQGDAERLLRADGGKLIKAMIDGRLALATMSNLDQERESLNNLRSEWEGRFAELESIVRSANQSLLAEQKEGLEGIANEHQKLLESSENASKIFETQKHTHQAKMKEIEDAFLTRMQLEAPVQYWKIKQDQNFWVGLVSIAFFLAAVAAIVEVFYYQGPVILSALRSADGQISIGSAFVVFIPTLAYFWAMRLIARIFLNALQQNRDASYRVTMVQTFLALLADQGSKIEKESILIILSALFRSPDGHSGDDAIPPNLLEVITKAANRS